MIHMKCLAIKREPLMTLLSTKVTARDQNRDAGREVSVDSDRDPFMSLPYRFPGQNSKL